MFVSFLVFLVASLVMLAAVVLICAPFSVEIRVNQKRSIEFKFGHSMPNVWACVYWLTIELIDYDEEGEIAYASIIYGFWRTSKRLYLTGMEDEDSDEDPGIALHIHFNTDGEEREMGMCPEEREFEKVKARTFKQVVYGSNEFDEYL